MVSIASRAVNVKLWKVNPIGLYEDLVSIASRAVNVKLYNIMPMTIGWLGNVSIASRAVNVKLYEKNKNIRNCADMSQLPVGQLMWSY